MIHETEPRKVLIGPAMFSSPRKWTLEKWSILVPDIPHVQISLTTLQVRILQLKCDLKWIQETELKKSHMDRFSFTTLQDFNFSVKPKEQNQQVWMHAYK